MRYYQLGLATQPVEQFDGMFDPFALHHARRLQHQKLIVCEQRLREYSKLMNVETIFVCDIINEKRGMTADGRKIYTLEDIYPFADLVTYPSTFEGFGNAFLEAIYFKKPVVVNAYSIYTKDIKPKGFSVIEIDGYVTQAAVEKTKVVLDNQQFRQQMVELNYELGLEYFSYGVLHRGLRALLVQRGLI